MRYLKRCGSVDRNCGGLHIVQITLSTRSAAAGKNLIMRFIGVTAPASSVASSSISASVHLPEHSAAGQGGHDAHCRGLSHPQKKIRVRGHTPTHGSASHPWPASHGRSPWAVDDGFARPHLASHHRHGQGVHPFGILGPQAGAELNQGAYGIHVAPTGGKVQRRLKVLVNRINRRVCLHKYPEGAGVVRRGECEEDSSLFPRGTCRGWI